MTRATVGLVSALLLMYLGPGPVAGESGRANVKDVEVTATGDDTWRFDVTIASDDRGWDAYADAFEIVGPEGKVLGKRVLHHPHVDEQPFTRSLRGVRIPPDVERVKVRAHHSEAGYDGLTRMVELPR